MMVSPHFLTYVNIAAFLINTAVTYGIGVTGALFHIPTNAELSEKYQTLVTPAPYAFIIWAFIFTLQFIWSILLPLVFIVRHHKHDDEEEQTSTNTNNNRGSSSSSRSNNSHHKKYIDAIGYNYLYVSLSQAAWSIAFGTENILFSFMLMVTIWYFLYQCFTNVTSVDVKNDHPINNNNNNNHNNDNDHTTAWWWNQCTTYMIYVLPFTLHLGWITAASIVNFNVVVVSIRALPVLVQYYSALLSFVLVFIACIAFLWYHQKEYVVPTVLCWALHGIRVELRVPRDIIVHAFTTSQINTVRQGTNLTFFLVVSCIVAKISSDLVVVWKNNNNNQQQLEHETTAAATASSSSADRGSNNNNNEQEQNNYVRLATDEEE